MDQLSEICQLLTHRFREAVSKPRGKQVAVLLGAGCSQQYGLPGFSSLVEWLLFDFHNPVSHQRLPLHELRGRLERLWKAKSSNEQAGMLEKYLVKVKGSECPAYRLLARLARDGYIRAFINLNFDTLLEEALTAEGASFKPYPGSSLADGSGEEVMVIKPHGSMGSSNSEITMDLAGSAFFSSTAEANMLSEILSSWHVVVLGYSGIDEKIVTALGGKVAKDEKGMDGNLRNVFVINPTEPSIPLLHVIHRSGYRNFLLTGDDAAFESFVFELYKIFERSSNIFVPTVPRLDKAGASWLKARAKKNLDESFRTLNRDNPTVVADFTKRFGAELENLVEPVPRRRRLRQGSLMTVSERDALEVWLDLAMDIRLSLNVSERSELTIEEHAYEIFDSCVELARNSGVCLTSPERFVLHCAAFIHDIGYYTFFSRNAREEASGLRILEGHGERSADLLRERVDTDKRLLARLMPDSYKWVYKKSLLDIVCSICKHHVGLSEEANFEEEVEVDLGVEIAKVSVKLRPRLVCALFTLAEDLAAEHPFRPASDPLGPESIGSRRAILDPVLDCYLKKETRPVRFERLEYGRLILRLQFSEGGNRGLRFAEWLLGMTKANLKRFLDAAADLRGVQLDVLCIDPQGREVNWESQVLQKSRAAKDGKFDVEMGVKGALEERLSEEVKGAIGRGPARQASRLDILLIYSPPSRSSEKYGWAADVGSFLKNMAQDGYLGSRAPGVGSRVIGEYLKSVAGQSAIPEDCRVHFRQSFKRILYPAWRFCARNWRDEIETLSMAHTCLELGSSIFRPETFGGIRALLGSPVTFWPAKDVAMGHDDCTFCSSRLLTVLAKARELFGAEELESLAINDNKQGIDETIAGLCRNFLNPSRPPDAWLGRGPYADWEDQPGSETTQSVDYLACAVRSLACVLTTGKRLGRKWLDQCSIVDVDLRNRFDQLVSRFFNEKDLLSYQSEQPHSLVLGHSALACLELWRRQLEFGDIIDLKSLERFAQRLDGLRSQVATPLSEDRYEASRLTRLYSFPVEILCWALSSGEESQILESKLMKELQGVLTSHIWLRSGRDSGSWGYSLKNTSVIAEATAWFWWIYFEKRCSSPLSTGALKPIQASTSRRTRNRKGSS